MVCGLFSACFQAVFGSFAKRLQTPIGACQRVTLTHASATASMGPILRHVFEPDPSPFCEVPVKLAPSPVKRHFGMGPIFGLRFLPTTGPSSRNGGNLAQVGQLRVYKLGF